MHKFRNWFCSATAHRIARKSREMEGDMSSASAVNESLPPAEVCALVLFSVRSTCRIKFEPRPGHPALPAGETTLCPDGTIENAIFGLRPLASPESVAAEPAPYKWVSELDSGQLDTLIGLLYLISRDNGSECTVEACHPAHAGSKVSVYPNGLVKMTEQGPVQGTHKRTMHISPRPDPL